MWRGHAGLRPSRLHLGTAALCFGKWCKSGVVVMEWRGRRRSENVIDGRAAGAGRGRASAGGIGGIGLVAVLVIGYFLGIDVSPLLNNPASVQTQGSVEITAADQEAAEFASVTLGYTEEVWAKIYAEQGNRAYTPAKLFLFKGSVASACGEASAATGPFYCPGDKMVYLDTDFFTTMQQELGAKGDFAMAYVVAHEVAHYIQDDLGILTEMNALRAQSGQVQSNAISVGIELQADCLAGIWARNVQEQLGAIQKGDFQEAFDAAKRIGDDTLQRNAGRRPTPESFTHGTSEQRSGWFATGLNSGQIRDCNTFAAMGL